MDLIGLLMNWSGGEAKSTTSLKSVTHPTMMKLDTVTPYLQKIQKNINHVTHPLRSTDIRILLPKNSTFS